MGSASARIAKANWATTSLSLALLLTGCGGSGGTAGGDATGAGSSQALIQAAQAEITVAAMEVEV